MAGEKGKTHPFHLSAVSAGKQHPTARYHVARPPRVTTRINTKLKPRRQIHATTTSRPSTQRGRPLPISIPRQGGLRSQHGCSCRLTQWQTDPQSSSDGQTESEQCSRQEQHVGRGFLHNLGQRTEKPTTTTPEVARDFAKLPMLPEKERRPSRLQEWCHIPETRAALKEAFAKQWEARRAMKGNRTSAAWKDFRASCKRVSAAVQTSIHAHLEKYVTKLLKKRYDKAAA